MDLLQLIGEDRLPSTFESSSCELGRLRDTGSHPQYSGTPNTSLNRRYVNQTSSTTYIICSMYTCVQKGTRRMAILLEAQLLDHNLWAVCTTDRNQSLQAECHHFHYEKHPYSPVKAVIYILWLSQLCGCLEALMNLQSTESLRDLSHRTMGRQGSQLSLNRTSVALHHPKLTLITHSTRRGP
ncbi:3379_t:CDS:1 [Acaulospora colombiana]|uniref:3379_t:CDS:1 n=1 Tax=Acaulospora colombiana TaxID=27376 RepID=A0ACA9PDT3_9GLOM|nr:3379_t:CDS:1 [Acaulospora colombiana]